MTNSRRAVSPRRPVSPRSSWHSSSRSAAIMRYPSPVTSMPPNTATASAVQRWRLAATMTSAETPPAGRGGDSPRSASGRLSQREESIKPGSATPTPNANTSPPAYVGDDRRSATSNSPPFNWSTRPISLPASGEAPTSTSTTATRLRHRSSKHGTLYTGTATSPGTTVPTNTSRLCDDDSTC